MWMMMENNELHCPGHKRTPVVVQQQQLFEGNLLNGLKWPL